jgi:hypothetical protein
MPARGGGTSGERFDTFSAFARLAAKHRLNHRTTKARHTGGQTAALGCATHFRMK